MLTAAIARGLLRSATGKASGYPAVATVKIS
jgi:hypothetical protein